VILGLLLAAAGLALWPALAWLLAAQREEVRPPGRS
jgi:hypothetical protein